MRLSPRWLLASLSFPLLPIGCGSTNTAPPNDSGANDSGTQDSGPDVAGMESGLPSEAGKPDGPTTDSGCTGRGTSTVAPTASKIKHLIVVVQENHSFDNYFGNYCTAATGSKPTCNTGPACCEAGPATDTASGDSPGLQDDKRNGSWDPDHDRSCEVTEIDDGAMDRYVTSGACGSAQNFAYADGSSASTYWGLAGIGALADNYFQPTVGASSSNDMYFATANYVFTDNTYEPVAIGADCAFTKQKSFTNNTVADLLVGAKVDWGWYGQGYGDMLAAEGATPKHCPTDPMCPAGSVAIYPCIYDPSDDPFLYFKQFADNPKYIFDYTQLACDLASSTLPAVSYVKAIGYRTEHPGLGDTISAGEAFVTEVRDAVKASVYDKDTLVLVTWDESGGFYDHVAPPSDTTIDGEAYGPRVPLFALGTFAKKNHISHVQMEHSSIVKFIEWNWLGKKTGQLGTRDTAVNNIGDMLDPSQTGTIVPSD